MSRVCLCVRCCLDLSCVAKNTFYQVTKRFSVHSAAVEVTGSNQSSILSTGSSYSKFGVVNYQLANQSMNQITGDLFYYLILSSFQVSVLG